VTITDRISLSGRVVAIAGAANPIGAAIAHACLVAAASKVVLVDRNVVPLEELASRLDGETETIRADLSSRRALARFDAQLDVDTLVNVPWGAKRKPFAATTGADWLETSLTMVQSVVAVAALVLPKMIARRRGSVVNLVSEAGRQPLAGFGPAYCGAMAAVAGLTKALAREAAPAGVRVNTVGYHEFTVARGGALEGTSDRSSRAAGIAAGAVFLLSDAAAYITGETLTVGEKLLR